MLIKAIFLRTRNDCVKIYVLQAEFIYLLNIYEETEQK